MSFNTPLPNVAWKAFPAVFCGNAAVVKPSEHTPASALALRRAGAARPACRRACSTSSRVSARRRAPRSSSTPTSTSSASRARRRPAAGSTRPRARRLAKVVPRARRQERARRLRRRRPRERGALGARVGVLERRAALRGGEPARRVRRRLRRVPRAVRGEARGARAGAGDQRGEPRAHPRGDRRRGRRGRDRAVPAASGSTGRAGISPRRCSKARRRTPRSRARSSSGR